MMDDLPLDVLLVVIIVFERRMTPDAAPPVPPIPPLLALQRLTPPRAALIASVFTIPSPLPSPLSLAPAAAAAAAAAAVAARPMAATWPIASGSNRPSPDKPSKSNSSVTCGEITASRSTVRADADAAAEDEDDEQEEEDMWQPSDSITGSLGATTVDSLSHVGCGG